MSVAPAFSAEGPLALICGGGTLPLAVAEAASKAGRGVVLFALRGAAGGTAVERIPASLAVCRPDRQDLCGLLARAGCRDMVFIGSLVRPSLWQVRPDLEKLWQIMPKVIAAFRGGDNHLLSGMAKIIEQEGFRLLGAHAVAPEILVPEGALGRAQASRARS